MEEKKPAIFGRRFRSCTMCWQRGIIGDRASHLYLQWHHAIVPRSMISKLASADPELWLFFMESEENCQLVHERCHRFAYSRREGLVWTWITYRRFYRTVEPVQRFVCEALMKRFEFGFNVDMPTDVEINMLERDMARRNSEHLGGRGIAQPEGGSLL